jgi:hypothetical protein
VVAFAVVDEAVGFARGERKEKNRDEVACRLIMMRYLADLTYLAGA